MKPLFHHAPRIILTAALAVVFLRDVSVRLSATRHEMAELVEADTRPAPPSALLARMEEDLSRIRLCISGSLNGRLSASSARTILDESEASLRSSWEEFRTVVRDEQVPENESALRDQIHCVMRAVPDVCHRIDEAYSVQDRQAVLSFLLTVDWPVLESTLVRPIHELRMQQDLSAEQRLGKRFARLQRTCAFVSLSGLILIFLLATCLLRLGLHAWDALQPRNVVQGDASDEWTNGPASEEMVLTAADLSGIPFRDRTLGLLPFFLALPDAAPPIIRPVLHLVLASDQLPLFEGDPLGSCAWFTNAEGEDEGEGWIPRPCRLTGDLFRFEPVFNKLPDELMYLSPLFDDTNLFLVEPGDIATASDRDIPSAEPVESSARDAFRYAVTLHGIIEVPGFREPGGHDGRTVPVPIAASP